MSETVNELVIDALLRHFADSGMTRVQTALESFRAEHARLAAEVPSLRLLLDARRNECERLEGDLAAAIAERDALKRERDEARREVCEAEVMLSPRDDLRRHQYAAERGWDCFKQQDGGGA